ncbi:MAG: serine hydrolase domain-containing protein [Candidatus Thorarchaeota archaeon]
MIIILSSITLNYPSGCMLPENWPTTNWQVSTPEKQGINGTLLDALANYVDMSFYNQDGILIIKNGYIVFEKYYNDYNAASLHHIFSITKSIVSALIGIALDEGYLTNLDQKVIDFFPDYTIANMSTWKQEITIRHLLTMTSGLEWSGDDPKWFELLSAENAVQFMLNLPMSHEPGTTYNYNTGSSQLLTAILQRVTGITCLEFANEKLFSPLGIKNVVWEKDNQGINYGGTLMALTPRDLAKIGYLYLNNGTWEEQQIISREWIENSTISHLNSFLGFKMGYLWTIDTLREYYFGMGAQGQKLCIFAKYDLVIVFTAFDSTYQLYNNLLDNYILPALDYIYTEDSNLSIFPTFILSLTFIFIQKNHSEKKHNV